MVKRPYQLLYLADGHTMFAKGYHIHDVISCFECGEDMLQAYFSGKGGDWDVKRTMQEILRIEIWDEETRKWLVDRELNSN